jgi:pimeloyl-ACP methyl ester carboxylesterase
MSFFEYRNHRVHYESDGEGYPVLILNGIMMSTKSWAPFIPTLKEHFRVLRLDFFDQGDSATLPGETYTQDIQVDLIKGFLDHLGLSKVNIVGISYGGEVALAFALQHSAMVNRLVVFNSCSYTNPWLKDIGRGWIKAGRTRDGEHYYQTTIPVIYSPHFYIGQLEWMRRREAVLVPLFSNPEFLDRMERLTRSAESYDLREKIANIQAPTLVVSAEEDYLTPIANQETLVQALPNGEWIKIPLAGHASMYEKPLLFTTIITGFFLVKETTYAI